MKFTECDTPTEGRSNSVGWVDVAKALLALPAGRALMVPDYSSQSLNAVRVHLNGLARQDARGAYRLRTRTVDGGVKVWLEWHSNGAKL